MSVDELGSRTEIDYIHEMLEMGTGADRQLKVFQETGDLKKVVDYMVAETRVGVFEEAPLDARRPSNRMCCGMVVLERRVALS